jgi:dnd system-associated protein 4
MAARRWFAVPEESSAPRDIYVPEAKQPMFKELTENSDSPFFEETMTDLFVYAAAYGYNQGLRTELADSKHALFQRSSLSESQVWILKSVVVKETENPDILKDEARIFEIAREFANGGIDQIYTEYTGPNNMFSQHSKKVINMSDI